MGDQRTTVDGVEIERLSNSAVRVESGDARVYVDVFEDALSGDEPPGDVVLSTHRHWDHFDPAAIDRVAAESAAVVVHETSDTSELESGTVVAVGADESHTVDGVRLETVPAHNLVRMRNPGEPYHPEGAGVGYVFEVGGVSLYHPGDTDPLDHMARIDVDVMFVPIGGAYVQSLADAHWAVHMVQPDVAIPIHYGYVEGAKPDPSGFEEMIAGVNADASLDVEPRVL